MVKFKELEKTITNAKEGETIVVKWEYTDGDKSSISNVVRSCGCLDASWDDSAVYVKYKVSGARPIHKSVVVQMNDGLEPFVKNERGINSVNKEKESVKLVFKVV